MAENCKWGSLFILSATMVSGKTLMDNLITKQPVEPAGIGPMDENMMDPHHNFVPPLIHKVSQP